MFTQKLIMGLNTTSVASWEILYNFLKPKGSAAGYYISNKSRFY